METVPLELFILPPLFDLPSVSGACIAAVSLCTLYLPQSSLQIIETTDLSIAPPALKHGKHHWYRGYTAIKHFLARENDIDSSLTREQKADLVAWESLIQDVGETLAWTTLFVSRDNYLGITRRELSRSLRFPQSFILPTELRSYAVRRCEDIGFTESLEDEPSHSSDSFGETWITRRISWDHQAHLLKLHGLASEFYTTLSSLVGSTTKETPFLFGRKRPSSLDAVVYGHLSLHLFPTLPDPTLRTIIVEMFPGLAFYLHTCHDVFCVKDVAVEKAVERGTWRNIVEGWGVEKGKRKEDLVGLGGVFGVLLAYTVWTRVR